MRLRVRVTGLVQGVGFRPFVYRLAVGLGLSGYVRNDTVGVLIEVEGHKERLDEFLIRLESDHPPVSRIYSLQHSFLEDKGLSGFEIRDSDESGEIHANILPDISTCDDCLREMYDPSDRRHRYPFINCTNCGPRFTIIERLPYDRKNTSMRLFRMCPECEKEYHRPDDRRFHAQPNACHMCGPHVALYDIKGLLMAEGDTAIERAVDKLRNGAIVALKGIGGFHLMCDATDDDVVNRLRQRKCREEKPMAVMFPGIEMIRAETHLNRLEERAICSIERPIVIVRKREDTTLSALVSPNNSTVGVFMPYTPLHHMIIHEMGRPLVATSANRTDDPIVKDDEDAFRRLNGIADFILTHNRPIVRRCDDSVVKVMAERQVPVRRSRGFVPLPVIIPFRLKEPVLALGAYMNTTIALGIEDRVYLSQHIGDLDTPLAMEFYGETIKEMLEIFDVRPAIVVCDLHPNYYSTRYGERHFSKGLIKVQHHFSHILSCMIENEIPEGEEVIGFAFDGTGYGTDRSIWGGEVMIVSYRGFKRLYHLRPYRLPGGEKAIREPFRTALSLLYETFGDKAPEDPLPPIGKEETSFLIHMIKKGINSPVTTSMGRLFDGVSSIIGLRHRASYHAQAAIELEQLSTKAETEDVYPFVINHNSIDWRPIIQAIVMERRSGIEAEVIAKKFHNTIMEIVLNIAETLKDGTGIRVVALSGGVFQNTILTEGLYHRLKERGFIPLIHQLVPPNDGGISLGQIVAGHFHNIYNNL
jgi:hydrogenase maturation protein HypF